MPIPLKDQICFSLYATSMAVGRMYKPMLDEMGITYPQYLVLTVIGESERAADGDADGLTIGAIAARLDLESSTITPPVQRLEQAGLVTRRRSKRDERQVLVRLTEAGRATLQNCECLAATLLERSGMTAKEIGALNGKIQKLQAALTAES
jgi:DNA-binding MarR family transcriptional regulator